MLFQVSFPPGRHPAAERREHLSKQAPGHTQGTSSAMAGCVLLAVLKYASIKPSSTQAITSVTAASRSFLGIL